MNPELFNPFGCYLLSHQVPETIFKTLCDEVDSVRSQLKDENFLKQNSFSEYLAGKNSHQIKVDRNFLIKHDIESYVLSLSQYYIQQIGAPFPEIKMGSLWINYGYKGDFNPIHTHDSLLSGCFYIHQDDNIMQEMEAGSHGRATSSIPGMTHFVHDLNYHPFNRFTYANKFEKGKLIMFPSWLTHWVNPFQSDGERVTIAFNILEA